MSSNFEVKSTVRVSGGTLTRFTHTSSSTKTTMTCAVFLPAAEAGAEAAAGSVPFLTYLSGLTCTDENVCQKSGVFEHLARARLGFVAPDTSPRGAGIEGEAERWDFGVGAGFYLDATVAPYSEHYNMYSYITKELPAVLAQHFPALNQQKVGLFGHSMGGHGALTIALKNTDKYVSVSAFAPICKPTNCPWGLNAFTGYLGAETRDSLWKEYDACELLYRRVDSSAPNAFADILVDVGTSDPFLSQLQPEALREACAASGQPLSLRMQEGYDHSYYFISTFMGDHVAHHAKYLC